MINSRFFSFLILWLLIFNQSCVHLSDTPDKPPVLTEKTDLDDILNAAITFGGSTLSDAKEIIGKQNKWEEAGNDLYGRLADKCKSWDGQRMINGLHLYLTSRDTKAPELFKVLVATTKGVCQPMAWHLAAAFKSPKMAQAIEDRLSKALINDELDHILQPKVADALLLNQLKGSYTVAKHGLFTKNHVSFAKAMIGLNPERASWDFVDYLALASVEELRQLNIESVDMFSCNEALDHLLIYPVAINHPKFSALFLYAVSRNPAFSETGRKIIELYLPRHGDFLAQTLSRMPNWVQIAYIDASRRDLNPKLNLFLARLKNTSGEKDIIDEIDSVVR